MPFTSRVNPRSAQFQQNRQQLLQSIAQLRQHLARAHAGGGDKYNQRHLARGKLLPRQRIDLLLDRGSPFLELMPLAGVHDTSQVPGGASVAGVGYVSGTLCLVSASEATVQGGAVGPIGVKKASRLAEIALENQLPTVHLIESAGADLPNQSEIFVPGGEVFRSITQRSARRIPTISLVFGSCTAGGAYIPGVSDYVVMVKNAAYAYLAGPPLVKMAIGEVVDDETLGGAQMHATRSGLADFMAEDEADCIRIGRQLMARLGGHHAARPIQANGDMPIEAPRYDADELLGIATSDLKVPFDAREVIARLVDGSRFTEFKPSYGATLVTGYAQLAGFRIGILANNGVLYGESANKGAQFIALCNQTDTPLLFLQNVTGFMVGQAVEEQGIIVAGSKMINAVSNSTVPAITVMMGASYGAGNYAMMGRAYRPRFVFSWPNHKLAVMGPEQLSGVLDIIKRDAAAKAGKPVNEEELAGMKKMLVGKVDYESTCWAATGRLFDDGVIDPRDTRTVLAFCLSIIYNAPVIGTTSWGVFRH